MMLTRKIFFLTTVAVTVAVTVALPCGVRAQTPSAQCSNAQTIFQDACQKTVDIFDYLAPQLGTAVAGGNATLGQAGVLGGFGHFSLGVRGAAVNGNIPKFNDVTLQTTGTAQSQIPTTNDPVPMGSLEAGVGLFRGIPMGKTYVGGIDALVDAFYLPSYSLSTVSIQTKTPWRLGFGGRLGILQDKSWYPAISVTYVQRNLPTTSLYALDGSGDSLKVQDLSVKTTSWRVVAGKHFSILGLSGGYGKDMYNSSAKVGAEVSGLESSADTALATPSQQLTRTNYFGDVTLRLSVLHITGEVGGVQDGTVTTYNTFLGRAPSAFRTYAAAGIGFTI